MRAVSDAIHIGFDRKACRAYVIVSEPSRLQAPDCNSEMSGHPAVAAFAFALAAVLGCRQHASQQAAPVRRCRELDEHLAHGVD